MNSINTKGKELHFHLSYLAIKKFQNKFPKMKGNLDFDTLSLEELAYLFYYAVEAGTKRAKEKFSMKFEEFEELLDDDISMFGKLTSIMHKEFDKEEEKEVEGN